jgi:hypothetical protein
MAAAVLGLHGALGAITGTTTSISPLYVLTLWLSASALLYFYFFKSASGFCLCS